jgi:hypothetical protein
LRDHDAGHGLRRGVHRAHGHCPALDLRPACPRFFARPDIYLRTALDMIDAIWRHFEPQRAIKMYKKYLPYLAANFVYGHSLWPELARGATREE